MGSLCLSSAPILRCESFTRIENIVLIIPTGLEIIFSTSLIFTNWGTGWKHLLLTAEGWTYLALALLELLTHIIPAVRDDLRLFRTIDIVLASVSFIPILFYTLFLFIFMRAELVDVLPKRFRNAAQILLLIFIPAIVILNEVSSFIGITHRVIQQNNSAPFLAIGFSTNRDQTLWTFFSSLTLALLTAYQAVNFAFSFFRLAKAFLHQRAIETSSTDEAHLFRGIGWISGAYKLGAIETVIGFAQGGFGGALTRRILRFLSRAFLCIGLVKGVDAVVDFRELKDELYGNKKPNRQLSRRSSRKLNISNPRHSTFRQLSPTAISFHAAPAPPQLPGAAPPTEPRIPQPGGLTGMSEFAELKRDIFRRGERVAVEFDAASGRPPTLHMRFSALDMPDPSVTADFSHLQSQIQSGPATGMGHVRQSSYYANSTMTRMTNTDPYLASNVTSNPIAEPEPARIHNAFAAMSTSGHGHTRDLSQMSGYADSVNSLSNSVVNNLAAQFPGLPPRVTNVAQYRQTLYEQQLEREKETQEELARKSSGKSWKSGQTPTTGGLSASNSFKRKPVPRASAYLEGIEVPAANAELNGSVRQAVRPEPVPIDPFDDTEDPLPTPGPISEDDERLRNNTLHGRTPGGSEATSISAATTDYNFSRPWVYTGAETATGTPGSIGQSSSFTTPSSENPFKYDEVQQVQPFPARVPFILRSTKRRSRVGSRALSTGPSELAAVKEDQDGYTGGDIESQRDSRGGSMDVIDISWLKRPGQSVEASPNPSAYEDATFERAMKGRKVSTPGAESSRSGGVSLTSNSPLFGVSNSKRNPALVRIKSVGKAPKRYTPTPVKTNYTRGSIYIEPIVIPPRGQAFSEVQLEQGSVTSSVAGNPLRDSEVLGADDKVYMHAL